MANAKKKDVTDTVESPVAEPVTDASPETPELEVVAKADPITMHRMQAEVEVNTHWRMTVKQGVTPDQCMDEAFWCHVGGRLIAGDTLIVRPDDSAWEMILNVVNSGVNFAHVHKKSFCELVTAEARVEMPSLYSVDYAGPIHKHRFLRDGKMMRDGFATKELAQRAAQQHQMAVNRSVPK